MKKCGFTIVELLMVIGIISVLMGIITTAASSSVKASRIHKRKAIATIVQAGLSTYYAQNDKWPFSVNDGESKKYEIDKTIAAEAIRKVIREGRANANPMMDISGLFVSTKDGNPTPINCNCDNSFGENDQYAGNCFPPKGHTGRDFSEAIRGRGDKQEGRLSLSQMNFGYPHPDNGGFLRLRLIYNPASDMVEVMVFHRCGE